MTILHSIAKIRGCSWTELPAAIKQHAEMRFHFGLGQDFPIGKGKANTNMRLSDEAYEILGVAKEEGAVCIVRPDGYVGIVTSLENVQAIEEYLATWLTLKKI